MPVNKMSDNIFIHVGAETVDIGGTNVTSASVDMAAYDNALFVVEVGTWNGADTLVMLIQQDTVANMASPIPLVPTKTLSVAGPTDGYTYAFEVKAAELTDGQRYVAIKCSEAINTGVDNVTIIKAGYNSRKRYANLPAYTQVVS